MEQNKDNEYKEKEILINIGERTETENLRKKVAGF
jgi:hypothetical protein